MAPLTLKLATGNYGHTVPLKDGTVASDKIAFESIDVPVIINAFRRMIRGLEFDVSEMALSTYLCAKAHGKPITALPVFLVRAFHHGSIVYNVKSAIKQPTDLHGRRVGVRAYTVTTGVWNRGILASEYGVDLKRVTWVINSDEHVAEYEAPDNVVAVPFDRSLKDYLLAGEIDAAIGVPPSPGEGIDPLIPDAEAAAIKSWKASGVYPINHTLVVKDELLATHPWLAVELYNLFKAAKRQLLASFASGAELSAVDAENKRMQGILGGDPLPYGVEANRATFKRFVEFNVDQQVLPRKVEPEEVFERSTLALAG